MKLVNEAIDQACRDAGVTTTFLRSGSKSGLLPSLRKQLAKKFVCEYGVSLAETARQLGVTTNAVSYMVRRK